MPAWELSDSDSSTSSSSPPPEVPRRKRSRPRKQRSDDQADASAHAVVPAVAEASAHAVAPVGIEELVRPVGGGVFSLVGQIVGKRPLLFDEDDEDTVSRFVQLTLGSDRSLSCCSAPVQFAQQARLPRTTARNHLITTAAAAWAGSRAIGASFASWACGVAGKVVGVLRFVSYDETPLPLRVGDEGESGLKRGVAKLFQADLQVGILTEADDGEFSCSIISLPCPLKVLQRGTAACLKTAVTSSSHIPHWGSLQQAVDDGGFCADLVCADRAKANDAAEDAQYSELGLPRLRLPCFAHIMATSQGRGFNTVASDVSGGVAMTLYMRVSGQPAAFRKCVAHTLLELVAGILDAHPHPPEHPASVYRDTYLRLCLPPRGEQRFIELSKELTGDIREDSIILRVPGGEAAFDVCAWSERVAKLLVPSAIDVFARHRWCNSLETWSELALVSIHNILVRAGCKWLSGTPLAPVIRRPSAAAPAADSGCAWALSASEDEAAAGLPEDLPAAAAIVLASETTANPWVVLNDKNKTKAHAWFMSGPRDRLVAMRIAMSFSVTLLRVVEHIASERWQTKQMKGLLETGKFVCRMQAVLQLQTCADSDVRDLLTSSSKWSAIRPAARTLGLACLCFMMVTSTACAAEHLCLSLLRVVPFLLWQLLDNMSEEFAQSLLDLPLCMVDEFSRLFLRKFNTVRALLGKRCRSCLIVMGILLRWEICRIECRHALARKWCLAHGFGIDLKQLSARALLQRHAVLGTFWNPEQAWTCPALPGTSRKKVRGVCRKGKRKGQRAGGGGAHRAFVSEETRGRTFADDADRIDFFQKLWARYRTLRAENGPAWKRLCQIGAAGTTSAAKGGFAFSNARRRRSAAPELPPAKRQRRCDEDMDEEEEPEREDELPALQQDAIVSAVVCRAKRASLDEALLVSCKQNIYNRDSIIIFYYIQKLG